MIKESPIGSLPGVCRIKTGFYTGDGSEGLSITGIGFTSKFIFIVKHIVGGLTGLNIHIKMDQSWGIFSLVLNGTAAAGFISNTGITSIDSNGFTVTDSASNLDPNISGQLYDYICLG